jgi:hypothetical protein
LANAAASGSCLRRSIGSVSGRVKSAPDVRSPTPTSVPKIARQPASANIWPPIIGPSSGAIAMTVSSLDIICAARSP